MTSNDLLGPALAPPPGGLDGLRGLIRRRRRRAAGLALTIAMVVAAPLLLVPPEAPGTPAIAVDGGAALEWPSSEPDVRIFLVARVDSIATNRRAADAEPE